MISVIFSFLQTVIQIYILLIFIWVLMSWLPGAPSSRLGRWLQSICEPFMKMFRFIPPVFGIDFSPVIALTVLNFCASGLTYLEYLLIRH